MMEKYPYLKKYTWAEWQKREVPEPFYCRKYNCFGSVSEEEIREAEEKIGFQFPPQLREFYLEIGCGRLVAPYNAPEDYYNGGAVNEILEPLILADLYKPLGYDPREEDPDIVICDEREKQAMARETYDYMPKGSLPFFHESDSCCFLILRPHSDNPNMVWNSFGDTKIDEFERFIWRLYHEEIDYYCSQIDGSEEVSKEQ